MLASAPVRLRSDSGDRGCLRGRTTFVAHVLRPIVVWTPEPFRVFRPDNAVRRPAPVHSPGIPVSAAHSQPGAERVAESRPPIDTAPADRPFAEDLILARACLAGDEVATQRFLRRLACIPRMLKAISQRLGRPLDEQELEDLAQETLILAWRKLDQFSGQSRLESWCYGLARFEMMNAVRSKRRRPDIRAEPVHGTTLVDDGVEDPDLDRDYLLEVLAGLDPAEAEVLRLKHFEALTFEDLAARLAITPSTAKSRYYRGLGRLQERLRGKLGETTK